MAVGSRRCLSCIPLLLTLLVVASCELPMAPPLATTTAPDALEFTYSNKWSGAGSVTLDGAVLVVGGSATPDREETWETIRVEPTPEQWRRFWSAIRSSGVHRWSGDYGAGSASHAVGWRLHVATKGFERESRAWDIYPDARGRGHVATFTPAFEALVGVMVEITGGAFLHWYSPPPGVQ